MPRLLVSRGPPSPRLSPSPLPRCRRRHPFLPILFHARGSLSSATFFPYHVAVTRRVSLTSVHLIVGFVGAFVRATCSYLGRQSITSSRSRRTRTLLSPYVNELLIFRASDFFFFFFSSYPLSSSSPSPTALYHLHLILRPPSPRAHDTFE